MAATKKGFTLLELLVVVLISAIITVAVSLYLQKSVSSFKLTDDQSELAGRVKYTLERLRKCARHSISTLCNFQTITPLPVGYPIEPTETLFFLTNFDQDTVPRREAHFVWFDRYDATTNPSATYQRLLHVWQDVTTLQAASGLAVNTLMPPDMSAAAFPTLLAYLRNNQNFNAGGPSTVTAGWEILIEAPYPRNGSVLAVPSTSLPIFLGRWTAPAAPPGGTAGFSPSSGIAFLVNNEMTVTPASQTFFYVPNAAPPVGRKSILDTLCINGEAFDPLAAAYLRPSGTSLGSPHCQIYMNLYVDNNKNSAADAEEPNIQVMTSINLLLIPSAGRATP